MIDIAIIGVQKSGTTSLLNLFRQIGLYDVQHCMEFTYTQRQYNSSSWNREFQNNGKPKLIKSVGLFEDLDGLKWLVQQNQDIKFIVLARNPVKRAISAYNFNVRKGIEKRTLDQALAESSQMDLFPVHQTKFNRSTNYINAGLYDQKMKVISKVLAPENVLVLNFDRACSNLNYLEEKLSHFLNIKDERIALPKDNTIESVRFNTMTIRVLNSAPIRRLKALTPESSASLTALLTKYMTGKPERIPHTTPS